MILCIDKELDNFFMHNSNVYDTLFEKLSLRSAHFFKVQAQHVVWQMVA